MSVTNYISMDGMLIGEMTSGVMRNYGTDALGSVVETVLNGVEENTYQYKPYGGLLAKTGATTGPSFLWNGGIGYRASLIIVGQHYVRSRHYSELGLWSSVDKLWPGQAPYGYVDGRPVTLYDYYGLATAICIFGTCPPTNECGTSYSINGVGGFNTAGETDCDPKTGVFSYICSSDACIQIVQISHECSHVQDYSGCCAGYRACLASGATNCSDLWSAWKRSVISWTECKAYPVGIQCAKDKQNSLGCFNDPPPYKNLECCAMLSTVIASNQRALKAFNCPNPQGPMPSCPFPRSLQNSQNPGVSLTCPNPVIPGAGSCGSKKGSNQN